MKGIFGALLPGLITTGFVGATLLPAAPAAAGDLLRDIGIGAAAGAVIGELTDNGSLIGNSANGAAAGAAVNATKRNRTRARRNSAGSLVQDAGFGAAASVVTGVIIDNGSVVDNAVKGAATGLTINLLDR